MMAKNTNVKGVLNGLILSVNIIFMLLYLCFIFKEGSGGIGIALLASCVFLLLLVGNALTLLQLVKGKKLIPNIFLFFVIFINFIIFLYGIFQDRADSDISFALFLISGGVFFVVREVFSNPLVYSLLASAQIYLMFHLFLSKDLTFD